MCPIKRSLLGLNETAIYTVARDVDLLQIGRSVTHSHTRLWCVQEEVRSSEQAIQKLGGELQVVVGVDSFSSDGQRTAVLVKKVCPTPVQYPRRTGVPNKRPLGKH